MESCAATTVPPSVPATMPGVMPRTTVQFTAPWAWWARRLEIEVNMMLASEVPRARCMTCRGREMLRREDKRQHRHDDQPAPDAQQAGEKAGEDAGGEIEQPEFHRVKAARR